MILGYGVKNFFCFEDGVEVSFQIPKSKEGEVGSIANSICVKGANASGKTNLIKALAFLRHFICDSFLTKPEERIGVYTFFNNDNPSEFYIELLSNKIKYRYELSLTPKKVMFERLLRGEKRLNPLFEREENKITNTVKALSELEKINIRDNASVISTAYQHIFSELLPFYNLVNGILTNVSLYGYNDFPNDFEQMAELMSKDNKFKEFTSIFLRDADTGISDFKIKKQKGTDGKEIHFPVFEHTHKGKKFPLTYFVQSRGTKKLFSQALFFYKVISEGGVLIIDEIDVGLHPKIVEAIVGLFDNKKVNRKNGQLLFTTHSEEIINDLGKYRIYITEKEDNSSYAYCLKELPGSLVRNDRQISPLYRSGKLGGNPKLGKFLQQP